MDSSLEESREGFPTQIRSWHPLNPGQPLPASNHHMPSRTPGVNPHSSRPTPACAPPPSSPAPQLLTCLHSVRRAPAEFLLTSGPSHWLFPPSSLSSPHGSVRSQPKGHLPGSWPCPVRPPAPGFVLVLCGNRVSVCTPREPAGPGTGLGVISHHPIPRAPCITRTHRTCDEGRSGEPEAEVHSLVSGILGTGWPSG